MTILEICKNALENLHNTAARQKELASRNIGTARGAEWRRKFENTLAKIKWLEKLIDLLGVS